MLRSMISVTGALYVQLREGVEVSRQRMRDIRRRRGKRANRASTVGSFDESIDVIIEPDLLMDELNSIVIGELESRSGLTFTEHRYNDHLTRKFR